MYGPDALFAAFFLGGMVHLGLLFLLREYYRRSQYHDPLD